MMRSLFSGVAGMKSHQTKMDVIGNNIANTNTAGFKSSSVNFMDTYYQTISSATGANANNGTAGTNAKQIGLGSMVASITTNITGQGGPSTTNRALDVAINGEAFMVVRSGSSNYFTKSGALNVDEAGSLYCTTNNATVQGWMADKDGNIIKDTVKDLKVMTAETMNFPPEATRAVTLNGNIDPNDADLTDAGEVMTFGFYDNLGQPFTAKFCIKKDTEDVGDGEVKYKVQLLDVLDPNSKSIFVKKDEDGKFVATEASVKFGAVEYTGPEVNETTGDLTWPDDVGTEPLIFGSSNGEFKKAGSEDRSLGALKDKAISFSITKDQNGKEGTNTTFPQVDGDTGTGAVEVYFDSLTQFSKGGSSKLSYKRGDAKGLDAGYKAGKLSGISIDETGKVIGNYDNGLTRPLAQIAFTTFANPSGLEAAGNSLFAATLNSGEFDGVGEEITTSGGSLTVGALEMSNVDLANEFTQMITTQRGFQANSRIITTSDSMLEELVNLKR